MVDPDSDPDPEAGPELGHAFLTMVFAQLQLRTLDDDFLTFHQWTTGAATEADQDQQLHALESIFPKIWNLAHYNGSLQFSLAKTEVQFTLSARFSTGFNEEKAQQYSVIGMLRDIVVSTNDDGILQAVPKFGIAPMGSENLLTISNYSKYIEWCTLLHKQIVRKNGFDMLMWTHDLHSGMKSIYDLNCDRDYDKFPMFLLSLHGGITVQCHFHCEKVAIESVYYDCKTEVKEALELAAEQSLCVVCLEKKPTFLMENCRHLTHCESCRLKTIEHDNYSGVRPPKKLNKKKLKAYQIICPICREKGKIIKFTSGEVFMP